MYTQAVTGGNQYSPPAGGWYTVGALLNTMNTDDWIGFTRVTVLLCRQAMRYWLRSAERWELPGLQRER